MLYKILIFDIYLKLKLLKYKLDNIQFNKVVMNVNNQKYDLIIDY